MNSIKRWLMLSVTLLVGGPLLLTAQIGTGIIAGTARDNSGAVVPAVTVNIASASTGVSVSVTTNETGRFQSPPLIPGIYQIQATHSGFKQSITTVTLQVEQRLALEFVMEIGPIAEQITVEATAQQLQTESSSIGEVVTGRAIEALPLNGRNFARLIELAPGTVPSGDYGATPTTMAKRGATHTSINGVSDNWNEILVEGIENAGMTQLAVVNFPPIDALQEFKVQRSVADAQFGRGAGGTINMVYKSGGRDFHGNLFYFHRNAALDAKNYFDPKNKKIPHFLWHQGGGTFGGPLTPKRDKTFFFASLELKGILQGESYVNTVPTALMKTGNFGEITNRIYDPLSGTGNVRQPFASNTIPLPRIDSVGRNVLNLYPDPDMPGLVNNHLFNPVSDTPGWQWDLKVDHRFSGENSISARYTMGITTINKQPQLPMPSASGKFMPEVNRQPIRQANITDIHTVSPTMVNEARIGFSRVLIAFENPDRGNLHETRDLGIPGINRDELTAGLPLFNMTEYTTLGDNQWSPAVMVSESYTYADSLFLTHGNHSMRLGGRAWRRKAIQFQPGSVRGQFNIGRTYTQNPASPGGTGDTAADTLLGAAGSAKIVVMDGTRGFRRWEHGVYVQDDWKASRRLTLNLGLRWDFSPSYPWVEVADRMATFQPETGAVVPVNTKGVSRTAANTDWNNFAPRAGFAYEVSPKTVARGAYGIFYGYDEWALAEGLATNPPYAIAADYSNNQSDFAGARRLSQGFDLAKRTGGLTLMGQDGDFGLAYVQQWNFNIQRQLPGDVLATVGYVATKATKIKDRVDINQARPGPGSVDSRRPYPEYQAITYMSWLGNSHYHSLQVSGNRRLSRGLTFMLSYTWASQIDDLNNQDVLNRRVDRGRNGVRHNFVPSFVYDLPLRNRRGLTGALFGGWQVNGVVRLRTGPYTTAMSATNTLNGSGSQRADAVAGCNPNDVPGGRDPRRWFNPSCFKTPPQYTFGNAGVGTIVAPGTQQVDFSVFKNYYLAGNEARYVQFRAEFFNLFNTPQFNSPGTSIGASSAGVISSAGSPGSSQRTSRQVQFGLKIYF